jgi:hypothetical protein
MWLALEGREDPRCQSTGLAGSAAVGGRHFRVAGFTVARGGEQRMFLELFSGAGQAANAAAGAPAQASAYAFSGTVCSDGRTLLGTWVAGRDASERRPGEPTSGSLRGHFAGGRPVDRGFFGRRTTNNSKLSFDGGALHFRGSSGCYGVAVASRAATPAANYLEVMGLDCQGRSANIGIGVPRPSGPARPPVPVRAPPPGTLRLRVRPRGPPSRACRFARERWRLLRMNESVCAATQTSCRPSPTSKTPPHLPRKHPQVVGAGFISLNEMPGWHHGASLAWVRDAACPISTG